MEENKNLKIIQRLLELAKNQLDWSVYPKPFKEEYIWLSNIFNDSKRKAEIEFSNRFQQAVGNYKQTLSQGKGYGWFHSPENLIWQHTQIQQLNYVIYGEEYTSRELKFNEELGYEAYKDLIMQIDRTVLMTPDELKTFNEETSKLAAEILSEILKEEKEKS